MRDSLRIRPTFGVMVWGLAAAALLSAGTARAAVIYSNLGPGDTYKQFIGYSEFGPAAIEGPVRQAIAFSPGASAIFGDAQLALGLSTGTNALTLRLYDDGGGKPGNLLEQIGALNSMPPAGSSDDLLVTFNSALHPLLQADHTYWLLPFASGDTRAQWNHNNQGLSGPFALSTQAEPTGWIVSTPLQGAFQVDGTFVPEPSTLSLLGLGFVALAGWRRRSRRRRPAGCEVWARPGLEVLEDRLTPAATPNPLANINHFIIIYQENWSFDGLYGSFPGANGLSNAPAQNPTSLVQVDRVTGQPLSGEVSIDPAFPYDPATLQNPPPGLDGEDKVDPRFLNADGTTKVNTLQPYDLAPIIPVFDGTGDMIHSFYTEQSQIDGGKQDGYVSWTDNPGLVMSNYDGTNLPEGLLAQQYTMLDNFFHAAYGGSFLNHQFLAAAAAPVYPHAPASLEPVLDSQGHLALDADGQIIRNGTVTPATLGFGNPFDKNYAVNTIYSVNLPPDSTSGVFDQPLLPSQNDSNPKDPTRPYIPTIGDRLDQKNVSWKWYAGGWDAALAISPANPANHGKTPADAVPDPGFQQFIQPFAYYDNYAPWVNGKRNPKSVAHLQDLTNFYQDLTAGTLPQVSFIKQIGEDDEHPETATLLRGQQTTANIVHAIQNSSSWKDTAIIITYDENGGRWDHVSPPDSNGPWGDGTRVPTIIISPYAKQGFVDHAQHDTLSILKTIEQRFNLTPLNSLDAQASSLANDFQSVPQVSIGSAYVQPDAYHPGQFTLIVQGTEGADKIDVTLDSGAIQVRITATGVNFNHYFAQSISRIEIYGQAGNDVITVAPDVTAVTDIFTGGGNNVVHAGGGPSVVVGGAGKNTLVGGSAPSILISGPNASSLYAGSGAALLIAGTTVYDADAEALQALLAEWSSGHSYIEKVGHIVYGTPDGENGRFLLNTSTVLSHPPVVSITGNTRRLPQDLIFTALVGKKKDKLFNLSPGDILINIG